MHDLQRIAKECISEMKAIDIPIQDDKIKKIIAVPLDADGFNAHCIATDDGGYRLEIWEELLNDEVCIKTIKKIVCHELLHTCEGCMNHKGQFRRNARKMDKYYDYRMMVGDDDCLHPEKPILDILQCSKCKYVCLYRNEKNSREIRLLKEMDEELLPRCPYCSGRMVYHFPA